MVDKNIIVRHYNCKYCGTTHKVELDTNITEGRSKYPFPYVTLHDTIINGSEVKEVLAILYIDKDLHIRHQEIQEFGEGNLFSKEQVMAMTKPLMEEINILREELANKEERINELQNQFKQKNEKFNESEIKQSKIKKKVDEQDTSCRRKCPKCGNDDQNMIYESIDKKNIIMDYPRMYGKKCKCGKCGNIWH
ncbi:MAG: hypothetical protein ACFFBP_17875 [Promethearchaeota archaeon]